MGKTQPFIVADPTPAVLTAATTRRVKSCRANLIPEGRVAAQTPAFFLFASRRHPRQQRRNKKGERHKATLDGNAHLLPQRILVRRPRQNPVRLDKISISLDVIAGLKLETQVAGTYLSYWSYAVGV